MAAGPWIMYRDTKRRLINQTANPLSLAFDTFRLLLVTSAYTPNMLHILWSEVSANEVANGNGYATHGKLVDLFTTNNADGTVTVDCNDVSWPSSTFSTKYAVIAHDGNSDGLIGPDAQTIAYCDLNVGGGSVSPVNQTLSITIAVQGLFTVS